MPYRRLLLSLLLIPGLSLAANLKVVSEPWVPYIFEQNGELQGVDYETVQAVFRRMGHSTDWELMPWKRAILSVRTGRADAILDILATRDRREYLIFPSESLSDNVSVLFYSRQHPHPFANLHSLTGLTVGVSPAYTYGNPAFTAARFFTREPAPTVEANLLKLLNQRIDLAIIDKRAGLYTLRRLGLEADIGVDPQPIGTGKLYLAFHRNQANLDLSTDFNTELERFKQSEEYRQIQAKYAL